MTKGKGWLPLPFVLFYKVSAINVLKKLFRPLPKHSQHNQDRKCYRHYLSSKGHNICCYRGQWTVKWKDMARYDS